MISWLESHMLPCAYKSLLGFDCPACGAQRSFVLLLKGDMRNSFIMYPPLIPVLLVGLLWLLYFVKPGLASAYFVKRTSLLVLGVVLINYLVHFFI